MPTKDEIIADALLLLKSFKNDCRWKEFWREIHSKKIEERTKKILCLIVNRNKFNNKNSYKLELDLDLDLDYEEKKKTEGLDKCPGVRPVGIGEILRRLCSKCLLEACGDDVTEKCGRHQLCSGLGAGIEGGIHAMLESSFNCP